MTPNTGRVMLIAAGPGVLACAVMGAWEFRGGQSWVIDLLGAYPLALMAFLPGIPVLAWTLVRAFPPRGRKGERRIVRHDWLLASWLAPCWHAAVLHALFRSPLVDWNVVLRHSACLWGVTACGWLAVSRRSVSGGVSRPPRNAGRVVDRPEVSDRPTTEGTIVSPTAHSASRRAAEFHEDELV